MKKRQNNSARASALQITLSVALLSVSAILFASSFKAAAASAKIGFYPPLPVSSTRLGKWILPTTSSGQTPEGVPQNNGKPADCHHRYFSSHRHHYHSAGEHHDHRPHRGLNFVGFQGDFTFDSTVVSFPPRTGAVAAGLTASNWNVSSNILAGTGHD